MRSISTTGRTTSIARTVPSTCRPTTVSRPWRGTAPTPAASAPPWASSAIYQTFGWPPTDYLECSDIVLPFYGYFLGGARFVHEPLLKYRVHSRNSSLSLQSEKLDGEAQLLANDRSWRNHIAHAVFFDQEIDRLLAMSPDRFAEPARRVRALVKTQITEMARKLDRNRRELHQLRRSR
jgi:hypothetical protein